MSAVPSNDNELRERRLIEGVIARTSLFRGVHGAPLSALARQCWSLSARRGERFLERGARLPGVFAVAYGSVKLALGQPGHDERVLRLVQAGQTFGEPSALLGRPARYDAQALADCKLVIIPTVAIYALVDDEPRAARKIIHGLAERSFEVLAELESTSLRRGTERLAAYLLSLAGPEAPQPCTVRLPATKTVIASRLDMKKETFSRLLRALAEQGLISVAQRNITILDRERLGSTAG
ncbi:MAG: Crp/Fnr family transcriptional regulator [Betaproteobacteria bacterium]|nr:Crp/Fnr family transcriptional regulator [Betaproteobacteria bacterium]